MAVAPRAADVIAAARPAFERVVCAVDGSCASDGAVRLAVALAGCAQQLEFLSVARAGSWDARRALAGARAYATAHERSATTIIVDDDDVAGALLARSGGDSLVVVGSHGGPQRTGMLLGPVATSLADRAAGPLLVARPPLAPGRASMRILAAVDDSVDAALVAGVAGRIATACGGHVRLVHVAGRDYGAHTRRRLAGLALDLIDRTRAEPVVDVHRTTNVAAGICALARRVESSLVVIGRAGSGARMRGSVSELVAHAAPCSVLLTPVRDTA